MAQDFRAGFIVLKRRFRRILYWRGFAPKPLSLLAPNPSEDSEQSGSLRHDWDNHRDNLLGSLEPLCFENLNLP